MFESNLEPKDTRHVNTCQQENARRVHIMEKSPFGERLRKAFGNANNAQIARKIGVSPSAVVNYMAGRLPELPIILRIKEYTQCDLNWLLTGHETLSGDASVENFLDRRLRNRVHHLANEQARSVFSSADVVSEGMAYQKTFGLLVQVLVEEGLRTFGLAAGPSLLEERTKADAERLSLLKNRPTLDDRIRELLDDRIRQLVRHETGVSPLAQTNDLRDIIREIVREENTHNVFPLDLKTEEQARRKKTG